MAVCLYCYGELTVGEKDFHKRCSQKIFWTSCPPELPYTRENLTDLARQVIRSQTTLTGVQAKLSRYSQGWTKRGRPFYDCRAVGTVYSETSNRTIRPFARVGRFNDAFGRTGQNKGRAS